MTEIAILFGLAFICEFIDSSLGMGYGTTLTPLLILMGYNPLVIIPVILISELFTGGFAAYSHHRIGNVKFDFHRKPGSYWFNPISLDSRIALVLAICSIVGAIAASLIAISISAFALKLTIGIIVTAMGILILIRRNKSFNFSWKKIVGLGAVAAFNKGLSGGGYGPLVTSGQILSGVKTKSAVAITSMAESFTCLVAIITYIIAGSAIDWRLTLSLLIGAMASVPFSTVAVKRMQITKFTLIVGIATVILGVFTLYKVIQ